MGQAQSRGPDLSDREQDVSSTRSQRLSRVFSNYLERDAAIRPRLGTNFTRSTSSPVLPDPRSSITNNGTGQRRSFRISRSRTSLTSSLPSFFRRHSFRPSSTDINSCNHSTQIMAETPEDQDSSTNMSSDATDSTMLDNSRAESASSHAPLIRHSELLRSADSVDETNRLNTSRMSRSRTGSERTLLPRFAGGSQRSSRNRGEDQATMLSRLLSVAAAATAASLMGDDHRTGDPSRNVPGDSDDGSFDGFLQALQNGRIASALRQSSTEVLNEPGESTRSSAPLNFFRMFRFGNNNGNSNEEGHRNQMDVDGNGDDPSIHRNREDDGRMIPIIIVGIRSINPANVSSHDIPPFIDALSNFPVPVPTSGEPTIDSILRPPRIGTRFSHRRRASLSGLRSNTSNLETPRSQRFTEPFRPWMTTSEFPAGPRPPPSTPASPGMSTVSSGNTTPAETPSVNSSRRHSFARRTMNNNLFTAAEESLNHNRTPRPRRLSESDFARFGSGSSRRNGIVEPDASSNEGSRSWIIYVLGGSYPENHPIVTTPSLFTDSPSYEDMVLLSALLGPAKPPIASESDVASAPGLFDIIAESAGLVAVAVQGNERVVLTINEQCLVCLCEFEAQEVMRRLQKCGHMFHRECIDQWLMTGRNSCPLCREKGVDQNESGQGISAPETDAAASSRA